MAKKQLNVDAIRSELTEGSAFFRDYRKPTNSPTPPVTVEHPVDTVRLVEESNRSVTERSNARPPVRSNAKRIITRNSFEIYEDQMDSLRKLAYQEKMEGKIGSMSAMVRAAIDTYLEEKKPLK